jgi:hypothetical protein
MSTPFGYNKVVLEKCLELPEVTLTDMIYHFVLAKLIECGNNRFKLSKKIVIPLRTLRLRIHEIEARGYPIPRRTSGKKTWDLKDKEEYENRTGFDCTKRSA